MASVCSVYVYYKTDPSSHWAVRQLLSQLPQAMAEAGYVCRVQLRLDLASDGRHTWMEIHECLSQANIEIWREKRNKMHISLGLSKFISGEIYEVFKEI